MDWTLRSKVGGGDGLTGLGPIVFEPNPFTYRYAPNYHTTWVLNAYALKKNYVWLFQSCYHELINLGMVTCYT